MLFGDVACRFAALFALSSVNLAACASASNGPPETIRLEGNEQSDAEVYMPLVDDTVFAYDTVSDPGGERGMFTLQVSRTGKDRVKMQFGGKTELLRVRHEGIMYETGGYLLKAPVFKGSSFQGSTGSVLVRDSGVSVDTPAGRFRGCVRTVEAGGENVRQVATVYCPHVGIVALDMEDLRGVHRVAKLRSHGPRVDVLPDKSPSVGP